MPAKAIRRADGSDGLTAMIVQRVAAYQFDDLPDDVVTVVKQCLLDWVAVTLPGSREPLSDILVANAREDDASQSHTLVGRTERLGLENATLINGAASHALDYDDGSSAMSGHPSVTMISAVLALAEQRRSSGREIIEALVSGYETLGRIGLLVAPDHYERGFHATGSIGSFGAAIASGRLLGLDEHRLAMALGIAGTQTAGLKASFGTMCKPLHAGRAALNGLTAARLAARGFTASLNILEHPQGFAFSHSNDYSPEAALADVPNGFHLLRNVFKFDASCGLTHATIGALLRIRAMRPFIASDVKAVHLQVPKKCDQICNIAAPVSGLEIKFSLRMIAAFVLAGIDTADPSSYTDARAIDPDWAALRDRVSIELIDSNESVCNASVLLINGERLAASDHSGIPATDFAEQGRRLSHKFKSLAEGVLGSSRSARLKTAIASVESADDVFELLALTTPQLSQTGAS